MNAVLLRELALKLLGISGILDTKDAATLKLLVEAASEFNVMMQKIRNETEATAPDVWKEVSTNFTTAADAFEAGVKENS